jgi:ubiquinone/menaquinone biosynthesis C-methylase UbiE
MRHPPPHLAAALVAADAADEIEAGIWRSDGIDRAIAQYDTIGSAYDLVGGLDAYHRLFWGASTRQYQTFAEKAVAACGAGTLLDSACGSMLFTAQAHASNACGAAIGIDASLKMLRLARARLRSMADPRGMALLHGDVLRSPFRPDAFDAIICMHVAHVLDDLNRFLGETRRILKPGGRLFLTSAILVDSWRDRFLRMLCRRGIMAAPRRGDDLLAAIRTWFGREPTADVKGSVLFVQVTKPRL